VKLVTRYVVREHVGPLLFALSALTSLLMLQYVARQLANLAGKGLPWTAIAKFFVLSLPFTIAMTMPMAVLVATLYAFGRMAAEHEITAFKASGVRVRSLMAPVLVCAFLLSVVMVGFNDQILSRANHQLRILQQDIARTKPTLALRDQAMNAITDQFFIRVSSSNAEKNSMKDVVIYDLSKGPERKTIYADSGLFLLAPNGRDLQLQLFDGHSQEFVRGDPRRFQRSFFREQVVQVRGITQGFETSRSDTYKGDREMSICEMERKYFVSSAEYMRIRDEYIMYASRLVKAGTKTIKAPRERPARDRLAHLYCVTLPSLFGVKTAQAQGVRGDVEWGAGQPPVGQPPVGQPPAGQPPASQPPAGQPPVPPSSSPVAQPAQPVAQPVAQPAVVPGPQPPVVMTDSARIAQSAADAAAQAAALTQAAAQAAAQQAADSAARVAALAAAQAAAPPVDTMEMNRGSMLAATAQLSESREGLDSLAVEIQKKFALSFACLVFVLFGPPIALRFPRGGVGVTIGVSIVVFGLYYICLMGGEALADKGRLPAAVAMWIANVTFAIAGIVLLWRVESTVDSSRGGGIREWWRDRKVRRELMREQQARRATPPSSPAVGPTEQAA
jgi:lipopolysaccharide export system permease protein